ncbi:efflux RND transporter periplasmic adaptor subunit [Mucilaginibacter sp. RS28]|uniref:Efflux RND transporter periplasmic adaptor subunit n=1 Tax=Mucilaginibacter straminoryzae TaxID=2932774 RepID=A0A9X1X390_9SPHI|nr:efflux RND transporter periplasmic adaptor subunit [Mucilaginibacter straminoryzae]MCJ8210339.1 efflux RND transporter periplasmic adaptor subunit [Mucilaginibacter straminoryzae]
MIFTHNTRSRYAVVAYVVILSGLFSCSSHKPAEPERNPNILPDSLMRTLSVDTVRSSNVAYAIKFSGAVDFNADKVLNMYPLVSGTLQGINVMPGDYVKQGQVLGYIRSGEMANYSSSLSSAEAGADQAKRQLQQQEDFFKSGLASEVDVTNAKAAYKQALAALIAAKRVLKINGNNTDGTFVIKAPISGFVVQKNINNGMSIRTDNNAPMFTISDLKQVWVQANVYEENIGKVHEGDKADVTTVSYPDKIFHGRVDKLMNVLDPNTKVMKMRVVLDNPGYVLKPQMFATVTVANTEDTKALSVSLGALVFDHSQYYVIVLTGHNHVELRPVEVLNKNGTTAYISSGLKLGERVISSKAILIYGSLNS